MGLVVARVLLIGFVSCFVFVGAAPAPTTQPSIPPSWIVGSNLLAKEYTIELSQDIPEKGSVMGYKEFDNKALKYDGTYAARSLTRIQRWQERLDRDLQTSLNADLAIDLKILKDSLTLEKQTIEAEEKFQVVPFQKGTEFVFGSLMQLINPQSDAERKAAAVERFALYVNGQQGYKPVLQAFKEHTLAVIARSKEPYFPFRGEVEQYLQNSPEYVKGVEELLKQSGKTTWKETFEAFKQQAAAYDAFVKDSILPRTRKTPMRLKELYALDLKFFGIDSAPEELIEQAKKDFDTLYVEFEKTAAKVASKLKFKKSDPASVITELKAKKVTDSKAVLNLYHKADDTLAQIVKEHQLLTLPKAPLKIRIAGTAESRANPVPHLTQPPIVNNSGERPEFVVPSFDDGKLPFDDFSYEAAALVLTAHEGRPGHDLQFSSLLDKDVSLIRASYAFNSVNVEGWGLYAEDIIFPYLPLESQLVALQTRLWRVARMFLDPQVNLGQASMADVESLLTAKLGISKTMATEEAKRYAFRSPGQAPAYYYGLKLLRSAKDEARAKLAGQFKDRCFHDAVLGLGMVPLKRLTERLLDENGKLLICN